MMDSLVLLRNVLLALHLLAAAGWVGGMFYALVVLRPAVGVLEPAARLQVHMLTLKKFFFLVWHFMPLMLITGWTMVFLVWGGFAHLPPSINAMQGLAILMTAVFLYVFFVPWKRLRRAIRPGPELLARIRLLITVNLFLGMATIVAGALGHVW